MFVGDNVTRSEEGEVVTEELAYELASRAGLAETAEERSFPQAAQAYQDLLGRHARAFEAIGRPFDGIVDDKNVAFEDERKAQLYKLRGSLERPDSLVLTEDDYDAFYDNQASISLVLQALLARKTIVFAGYDLADANFRRLHRKMTAQLDGYGRRSCAFTLAASASVSRWCQRHDIELIRVNPAAFLQELVDQLATRGGPTQKAPPATVAPVAKTPSSVPLPERPYKLLDYFDTSDAAIFFGRDQEIRILSSLVHAHRLVLVYGASGTGKTSLVLAGAVPRLQNADPPYAILYVRVRGQENPSATIQASLAWQFGKGANLLREGRLVEALDAAAGELGRSLVIILDQFEEFFLQCGPQTRQAFIAELGEVYDARDLPVKVVLSLREDWLASINEIRQRIPEVFNVDLRPLPQTRQAARQAIIAPAEQLGLTYDPSLAERVLDDLLALAPAAPMPQAPETVGGASAEVVMPPQLQLVCDALYESARANRRKRIIMADYERVGGVHGVLSGYIERAPAAPGRPARDRPQLSRRPSSPRVIRGPRQVWRRFAQPQAQLSRKLARSWSGLRRSGSLGGSTTAALTSWLTMCWRPASPGGSARASAN